jgi:hypothetical protein
MMVMKFSSIGCCCFSLTSVMAFYMLHVPDSVTVVQWLPISHPSDTGLKPEILKFCRARVMCRFDSAPMLCRSHQESNQTSVEENGMRKPFPACHQPVSVGYPAAELDRCHVQGWLGTLRVRRALFKTWWSALRAVAQNAATEPKRMCSRWHSSNNTSFPWRRRG